MGRLIDADKLKIVNLGIGDYNIWGVEDCDINNAPTVEAIPKEEYENRLKADMMAILRELKNELIDVSWNIDMYDSDLDFECCYLNDIDEIIQQKINSLKSESEGVE